MVRIVWKLASFFFFFLLYFLPILVVEHLFGELNLCYDAFAFMESRTSLFFSGHGGSGWWCLSATELKPVEGRVTLAKNWLFAHGFVCSIVHLSDWVWYLSSLAIGTLLLSPASSFDFFYFLFLKVLSRVSSSTKTLPFVAAKSSPVVWCFRTSK